MPVRSLNSSVLRWPESHAVEDSLRQWVKKIVEHRSGLLRIGYFGSLARGDWGVGSDLDLIVVVEASNLPFERRAAEWDTTELPVPVDLLVYTKEEWQSLSKQKRFREILVQEAIWVYDRERTETRGSASQP